MKSMNKSFLGASIILAVLSGCASKQAQQPELTLSGLNPANFEVSAENAKPIKLYTLKNSQGMEVCVTNFGGRIVSVMVPDKNGKMTNVVLGFDSIADYQNIPSDFGASIGRYANRINKGKITIDGQEIQLPTNNFGHCLHGGPTGWQYQVYEANQANDSTIVLTMKSPDGNNNFPGNVTGDPSKPATDHLLYVASDSITPVDSTFMTTGEMMAVKDTPFDFNTPKAISEGVTDFSNEQVKFGNGFDHNWVLKTKGDINQVAAKLTSPTTGISLEVYTDEPGIQVYTGNFLDGTVKGKKGIVYPQRASVCLETQHYPDSPNKPQWPSVILTPGQTYHSHCIFKFTVEK